MTHRADELKRIEQIWRKGSGATGTIHMITFTAPHTRTQRPAEFYGDNDSRTGLSGAMSMFRQSKTWRRMKRATGHIADVRAVETTWGKASGYHIHIHMVLYFTVPVDLAIWRDELIDEWIHSCGKAGLQSPSRQHGLEITEIAEGKGDYLAKWGTGDELSSDTAKQAKNGNMTIHELEKCLADPDFRKSKAVTKAEIMNILRDFYEDMTGARMLQWGGVAGFKKSLIGEDPTDEQIVEGEVEPETHQTVALIRSKEYKALARADLISAMLDSIERLTPDCLPEFMVSHGLDPDCVLLYPHLSPELHAVFRDSL